MSIEKVDSNMQKGLAIIVGNNPDGTLLHTASILGYKICFLEDDTKITDEDELVYLIGHGMSGVLIVKSLIDNKEMHSVAKLLIKKGYTSKQTLYPIICHYDKMHTKLKKILDRRLSSKDEKVDCKIISKANDIIILVNGSGNLGELWNCSRVNIETERAFQNFFLKNYNMKTNLSMADFQIGTYYFSIIESFKRLLLEIFRK